MKITPYHCNHKSFDLSFSWDKREMITATFSANTRVYTNVYNKPFMAQDYIFLEN